MVVAVLRRASTKKFSAAEPLLVMVTGMVTRGSRSQLDVRTVGQSGRTCAYAVEPDVAGEWIRDLIPNRRFGEIHHQGPGSRDRVEGVSGQRRGVAVERILRRSRACCHPG